MKFTLRLENIRLREGDEHLLTLSKKFHFALYNTETK